MNKNCIEARQGAEIQSEADKQNDIYLKFKKLEKKILKELENVS
jgi:hypothetical protein